MGKLIISEFHRHFNNKFFYISGIILILFGILFGIQINHFKYFDDIYIIPLSIIISAYISVETGTEFHDRTLNNKIICGYERTHIYSAYIITGLAISSLMFIAFMLPIIIISHSLLVNVPISEWLKIITIYWLLCLVWTIFGIFSVVISSSKIIGCVLSLTVIFGLYAGAYVLGRFAFQPEFIQETYMDSIEMTPEEVRQVQEGTFEGSYGCSETKNGNVIYYKSILREDRQIPNPNYIQKPYSTILKQILDLCLDIL